MKAPPVQSAVLKKVVLQQRDESVEWSLVTRLCQNSERGVQYASSAYVERLESMGPVASLSAKGNPYDNAKAESFFKTLKREEVYLKEYRTFAEAEANIGQFLEDMYNQKLLHSSLGYLPPAEFEVLHYQAAGNVT